MCEACSWDQVTLATRFEARFVYRVPNSMAKKARSREGNRVKRLPYGNRLNPVLLHLNKTAERGYVDFSGCTANVWDCLDMSKTQEPLVRTENPSRSVSYVWFRSEDGRDRSCFGTVHHQKRVTMHTEKYIVYVSIVDCFFRKTISMNVFHQLFNFLWMMFFVFVNKKHL